LDNINGWQHPQYQMIFWKIFTYHTGNQEAITSVLPDLLQLLGFFLLPLRIKANHIEQKTAASSTQNASTRLNQIAPIILNTCH